MLRATRRIDPVGLKNSNLRVVSRLACLTVASDFSLLRLLCASDQDRTIEILTRPRHS